MPAGIIPLCGNKRKCLISMDFIQKGSDLTYFSGGGCGEDIILIVKI
jgi:hypothetical protein